MKHSNTKIVLCAILLISSCASPSRLYNKGDYYKAVLSSVKTLRTNPSDIRAGNILLLAYPKAVDNFFREIDNLQYSSKIDKYSIVVSHYIKLNKMAEEIFRTPGASELIPDPNQYYEELSAAKEAGAEAFYNLGKEALASNNIAQARLAIHYLNKTNRFVADYKDVASLIEEANEKSIMKILIQRPIANDNNRYHSDIFAKNLTADLRRNRARNRMRNKVAFAFEDRYEGNNHFHHIVVLDFDDFVIEAPRERQSSVECTRDKVLMGYAEIEGKSYPVYNTAKAVFTLHSIDVTASGCLRVKIIDSRDNRVVAQRNITAEHVWTTRWGSYQGDERALSLEQAQICQQQIDREPTAQDLFVAFTKLVYPETSKFLNEYYRRY